MRMSHIISRRLTGGSSEIGTQRLDGVVRLPQLELEQRRPLVGESLPVLREPTQLDRVQRGLTRRSSWRVRGGDDVRRDV